MPLRFTERDSGSRVSLTLIVLAALSLVLCIVYSVEGASGPLHSIQSATGIFASPFRSAGAGIQATGEGVREGVENANADAETLAALREQNQQLRQQVSELEEYRVRAQQLESIQKIADLYALDSLACGVVSMPSDSWNRVISIDKGSAEGVELGMPVMGSSGLVGQVVAVSDKSAEVRLLQDPSSGVAVIVQSNRAEALVRGNIDGLLYLEGLAADAEIQVGDTLVTSGLGGGYARGLIVGTVVRIEETNGQSVRQIVVAPNSTVSALDQLLVVKGIGGEGALSENAQAAAQQASQSSADAPGSTDQDSMSQGESLAEDASGLQDEYASEGDATYEEGGE